MPRTEIELEYEVGQETQVHIVAIGTKTNHEMKKLRLQVKHKVRDIKDEMVPMANEQGRS